MLHVHHNKLAFYKSSVATGVVSTEPPLNKQKGHKYNTIISLVDNVK